MSLIEFVQQPITIQALDFVEEPLWLVFCLLSYATLSALGVSFMFASVIFSSQETIMPEVPEEAFDGEECFVYAEFKIKAWGLLKSHSGTFREPRKATVKITKTVSLSGEVSFVKRFIDIRPLTPSERRMLER